jgi:hypothetical protein
MSSAENERNDVDGDDDSENEGIGSWQRVAAGSLEDADNVT